MCDCVTPEFYNYSLVTARKQHRCCECESTINKGQKYHRISGKWDKKKIDCFKICEECEKLREILEKASDCCVAFGEIYEFVIETGEKYWLDEEKSFIERLKSNQNQVKLLA